MLGRGRRLGAVGDWADSAQRGLTEESSDVYARLKMFDFAERYWWAPPQRDAHGNLWQGSTSRTSGTIRGTVPAHGVIMYRVSAH